MSGKRRQTVIKSVHAKLRSESGASITFALLLFLVCAVLSAAILVAGTTSAGRMSGLAETDQRYYSVTSGAQMLSDMMDNKTVSIVTIGDSTYRFYKPMNQVTELDINAANIIGAEGSNPTSIPECAAEAYFNNQSQSTFQISAAGDSDPLNVTATMNIDEDANTTFTVTNTNGKKKYSVLLTFSTDVRRHYPPILKERGAKDPVEITWHVDRMISSYDAK